MHGAKIIFFAIDAKEAFPNISFWLGDYLFLTLKGLNLATFYDF